MIQIKFKNYLSFILFCIILSYPLSLLTSDNEKNFFIIVNAENYYKNNIDRGFRKVELIYKGNSKEWPGKLKATFFSREEDNLAQQEFYKKVLKMQINEIKNYWERKIANGIYKPKVINNTRDLINEIARNKG